MSKPIQIIDAEMSGALAYDSSGGPVATVGELLTALGNLPMDFPVILEGCDCHGEMAHYIVKCKDRIVLVRNDGEYLPERKEANE